MRIWLLSKVLGWPGRRVASEVGVSQPTVVRTLERLNNDPPTEQEMQDFVTVATNATPASGLPILGKRSSADTPPLTRALTFAVIIIALAVTLVLVALAVSILTR
jgi:hypothetical protein